MQNDPNVADKQEEVQEYLMKLEIIKTQLDSLSQQSEIFELSTNELMRAKETLKNIKDLDGNKEILIPIGGDTFIYANISDVKKILIGIGADVVIEQDTGNAITRLESRLDNLNKTSQSIIQTIRTLQQQANDINMKIQELSKDIQG